MSNHKPFKREGKFHVSYMGLAFENLTPMIEAIRKELHGVKYDTIVVTGSSGMLVGPVIARALRKKLLVVRKPEEYESSHSSAKLLGELGERWIFLDDFVSGGATFRRVRDGVRDALKELNEPEQRWEWDADGLGGSFVQQPVIPFESELVGYVEYQSLRYVDQRLFTPWDENAVPGMYDQYLDDTPKAVARRKRRIEEESKFSTPPQVVEAKSVTIVSQVGGGGGGIDLGVEASKIGGCGVGNCIVCNDADRSVTLSSGAKLKPSRVKVTIT